MTEPVRAREEQQRNESEDAFTYEIAKLFPVQGQWTEQDYFALPETNRYLELSEGILVIPPHPTHTHQLLVGRLYRMLDEFVSAKALGLVQLAPLPVRLWPGKIREPDVLFVSTEHRDRIGEQAYGPPDLVMEVTSPGTRQVDRVEKFVEYTQASIPEYWIVDPDTETVEVFVLREGAYELHQKVTATGAIGSRLLGGFRVDAATLFSDADEGS